MTRALHFGLAQLNSKPDIQQNLQTISDYAQATKSQHGEVLFLPENALWMGDSTSLGSVAQEIVKTQILKTLQDLAKKHALHIHLGSYPEWNETQQKSFNTSCWINSDGFITAKYRKMHLFDVQTPGGESYQESSYCIPGKDFTLAKALDFQWGLSICFDVRFPDHYRTLFKQGAEIMLVPAAFTLETGTAHWHILLRARAVENLSYVIAAAQVGTHANGRKTYGHSLVVNPWGEVLFDAGGSPSLYMASIPYDSVQQNLRHRFKSIST